MTTINEPPEGWEVQPPENDQPVDPDSIVFVGPEGETKTLAEMVDAGLIAA